MLSVTGVECLDEGKRNRARNPQGIRPIPKQALQLGTIRTSTSSSSRQSESNAATLVPQ